MKTIRLCTGLLRRGSDVLLARCRYDGEPQPLWVLPGGRQEDGETIAQAVIREFREESSLAIRIDELAYVSESIDVPRELHVVNCTFLVSERDAHAPQPVPRDEKVVEVRFVPAADAPALLAADVLRVPVAAALSGDPHPRYFAFAASDVAVPFFGRTG
ncbi:MAG TPA: NUDIX hydrolase [Candidatus Eremiobacteraceae bacterium]